MSKLYNQVSSSTNSRFSRSLFSQAERSRMTASPQCLTTFNAGDIVPVYCREILPEEDVDLSVEYVIRQTTLLTPTMGEMDVTLYAFFVPNRIVNESWKAVQGENYSGSWTAPQISLAPLVNDPSGTVQIPVGSVADYYGFPTQQPLQKKLLARCHDLKFRGYVMIYNEFFRDQNYQPPIPISYLNVYQGFLDSAGKIPLGSGVNDNVYIEPSSSSNGGYGTGSIAHSLYGSGFPSENVTIPAASDEFHFRATSAPLKANKHHDYFTSVLPSPQKASEIFIPVGGSVSSIPVITSSVSDVTSVAALKLRSASDPYGFRTIQHLGIAPTGGPASTVGNLVSFDEATSPSNLGLFYPSNLVTSDGATVTGLSLSVNDLRMSAAMQQYYEILARGGSRYLEIVQSLFGVRVENPFDDRPKLYGKLTGGLELYQTAQTSASESGNTPQGNLAAFGYTSRNGHLCNFHALEHGYLHVFAVVRHNNLYGSLLSKDNFRLTALDYYSPPLANISEQPVYTYEINPFSPNADSQIFGYQEAWAEYRYEPDRVSGLMRPGVPGSLSLWNYSDEFDSSLLIADGSWLKSNSQEVLDRTLAVTSSLAPQFKAQFKFHSTKDLPMPVDSVPGMDII